MQLGPMMACNMAAFQDAIYDRSNAVEMLRYLEVGCSRGGTIGGLSKFMQALRPGRWQSVGLDKLDGGWEYGKEAFINEVAPLYGGMIESGTLLEFKAPGLVYFNDDGAETFLPNCRDTFDVVLIDACHGKECCALHFTLVEKLVNPGGYVFFHDADPRCQGKDLQPHCQQTIGVRQALIEIGFFSGRAGWWLVADIQPKDESNRGCVVVQKV